MTLTLYSRFDHCASCDTKPVRTDCIGICSTPSGSLGYQLCEMCFPHDAKKLSEAVLLAVTARLIQEMPNRLHAEPGAGSGGTDAPKS